MNPDSVVSGMLPLVAASAAAAAADPYPILWSSGSINASALAAAGIKQHAVFNWSPHDGSVPHAWNCSGALKAGEQNKGPCIQSLWPLLPKAGAPGDAVVNGGTNHPPRPHTHPHRRPPQPFSGPHRR